MKNNEIENIENQPDQSHNRASFYFDEDDENNIQDSENPVFGNPSYENIELDKTNSYKSLMKNSGISGVLNILASAIGGGCFTFPKIIDDIGPIHSFIIFLIVSLSIYFSLEILRSFIIKTNLFSYAEITNKAIGKKVHRMYCVFSIILFFSNVVNYISLIYSYFDDLIGLNDSKSQKIIYFSITCLIEIILCIFTSKISKVHILSTISVISFVIILLTEIFLSIQNIIINGFKNKFLHIIKPYNDFTIIVFFKFLSIFIDYIYSYTYHCSFPTLIGNLSVKSENETKKVNKISFIAIFISYISISIFGYMSTEKVPPVLFQRHSSTDYSIYVGLFKIILSIFLMSLIPIRYIVIRDSYLSLIKFNIPHFVEKIITVINIIIANIIGCVISGGDNEHFQYIKTLIELFGGIFGVVICFVLPVITYLFLNEDRCSLKSVIGYIIAIVFTIIGLVTSGFSIHQEITI